MERPLLVPKSIEEAIRRKGYAQYSRDFRNPYSTLTIGESDLIQLPSFGSIPEHRGSAAIYSNNYTEIHNTTAEARNALARYYGVALSENDAVPVLRGREQRLLHPNIAHSYAAAHNIALIAACNYFLHALQIKQFGASTTGSATEGLVKPFHTDADIIVALLSNDYSRYFTSTSKETTQN